MANDSTQGAASTGSGEANQPPATPAAARKNPIATASFKIEYLAGTPKECEDHARQVVQGLRDAGLKVEGTVKVHNPVSQAL